MKLVPVTIFLPSAKEREVILSVLLHHELLVENGSLLAVSDAVNAFLEFLRQQGFQFPTPLTRELGTSKEPGAARRALCCKLATAERGTAFVNRSPHPVIAARLVPRTG